MDFFLYAASSFWLGALHVLEPGHGKTVVAAYLVGSKGRMWDAVVLGLVTTFTHTFIVIILGVLSVVAAAYFAPERVGHVLEIVASALVIAVGLWMIVTRTRAAQGTANDAQGQDHSHEDHSHGDHSQAIPTGPLTLPGLIALGVSGGLVPCPGALAVLLAAVSLGQFVRGIALVLIFSLGMASTLVALGLVLVKTVAHTQKLFREARWQRYVPVVSAYLITFLGCVLLWRALAGHAH